MSDDTAHDDTTKKAPAKKSPTKKTPAKKAGAKKTPAKKQPSRTRKAPTAQAPKRATAVQVASTAAQQLLQLTGKEHEGVTGIERSEDGWTVQVEVVEVRRIPDTTDVLATYEIDTDDQGNLEGYRRLRRYARGVPGED